MAAKGLIIRFSSFGDIIQSFAAAAALRKQIPDIQIHWAIRSDLQELTKLCPAIDVTWPFERSQGLKGLVQYSQKLSTVGFDYVYDAHNNVRSHLVCAKVRSPHRARRTKSRMKRFLEFQMGFPQFEQPFLGAKSFVDPLADWGVRFQPQSPWLAIPIALKDTVRKKVDLPKSYVTLAPSAAWQMKRWPVAHWKELVGLQKDQPLVLLAGPEDRFVTEIADGQKHVLNLAGKLSLLESAAVVAESQALVSADTGMLHVGDGLGVKTIALIGPTAFGFPSSPTSRTLEVDLSCRPCSKDGRGKCTQSVYQRCMVEISPARVSEELSG